MTTASILVDLRTIRCGKCKVALHDELAEKCPVCGASFDRISSNPYGQNIQPDRKLLSGLVLRTPTCDQFRRMDTSGWPPNPVDCEGDNARWWRTPLKLLIVRNLLRSSIHQWIHQEKCLSARSKTPAPA